MDCSLSFPKGYPSRCSSSGLDWGSSLVWTVAAWSCDYYGEASCTRARRTSPTPAHTPPTQESGPEDNNVPVLLLPALPAHVAAEAKVGCRRHAQGSRNISSSPRRGQRGNRQEPSASEFLPYWSRSERIKAPPPGSWW